MDGRADWEHTAAVPWAVIQQAAQLRAATEPATPQTASAGHAQHSQVDGDSSALMYQESTGVQDKHLLNYCLTTETAEYTRWK